MRNPKHQLRVLLALLVLAAGPLACTSASSEGGIVGSGISSIQGNIIEVEIVPDGSNAADNRESGTAAGAPLPIVLVSIDESPGNETTTDAAGEFRLDGDFAGTVTVRFRVLGSDATLGTLVVEIGAGATLVLPDIEIRTDLPEDAQVQVRPPLQINLFGRATASDCAAGRLEIDDESAARNHFVLRLRDVTEIVDADDSGALRCEEIAIGDRVTVVEGIVDRAQGLIEIVKLRVQPVDSSPPSIVRVRRRGVVLRTACARGLVHFQDTVPNDVVSARLTGTTRITCRAGAQTCRCEDIAFGDLIEVAGTRRADAARSIEASAVHVTPAPSPLFVVAAAGDVAAIDCAGATVRVLVHEVAGDAVRPQEMEVRLSDDTSYRCFGDLACTCADVRPRDRVTLEALVSVDESTVPEALAITVIGAARLRVAGVIGGISCGTAQLDVIANGDTRGRISFDLTRATQFVMSDGSPATCRSLVAGARIGVSGHVERGVPGTPRRNVADLVRVERTPGTRSPPR